MLSSYGADPPRKDNFRSDERRGLHSLTLDEGAARVHATQNTTEELLVDYDATSATRRLAHPIRPCPSSAALTLLPKGGGPEAGGDSVE